MTKKRLSYKRRLPKGSKIVAELDHEWMGFEAGTTDKEASVAFEFVYGEAPARIQQTGGAVLAGPIPNE
ncbi:hypothetical protein LCGC14_1907270 [marine sediment metagenome]|uniref:Uncharacterized protein n=1 Tax=marine sediment metagenome TaxID=412755 RepID=A0A0F9FUQ3_9ZZZZ